MSLVQRAACAALIAWGCDLQAQGTFMKSYLSDTTIYAPTIARTTDGGYVMAGIHDAPTFDKSRCVLKVDSTGVLEWSRYYGTASPFDVIEVVPLASGDLLALTTTPVGAQDRDLVALRLDAAGDTVWTRAFDHPSAVTGRNAVELANGDLVLVSYTTRDLYLTRMTGMGSVIWSHGYSAGGIGGQADPRADVILTSDSCILACGAVPANAPAGTNGFVVKTDMNGDLIWAKFIGGSATDMFRSVVETADGGYLLMGYYTISYGYPMIVRMEVDGDVLWRKRFTGADQSRGLILERCTDGNYVVGGDVQSLADGYRALLFKISDAGELIWSNAYGSEMHFMDACMVDDGMVMAAANYSSDVPYPTLGLFAGDTVGASNCTTTPLPLYASDILLTESSVVNTISGLTSSYYPVPVSDLSMTELTDCISTGTGQPATIDGISVHPNPADERCFIHNPSHRPISALEIVDVNGRTVARHGRDVLAPIDVSALGPGIYLFRVFMDDASVICERVIVE